MGYLNKILNFCLAENESKTAFVTKKGEHQLYILLNEKNVQHIIVDKA